MTRAAVLIGGPQNNRVIPLGDIVYRVKKIESALHSSGSEKDLIEPLRGEYRRVDDQFYMWAGWQGHILEPLFFRMSVFQYDLTMKDVLAEMEYQAQFTGHKLERRTLKIVLDQAAGKQVYSMWGSNPNG